LDVSGRGDRRLQVLARHWFRALGLQARKTARGGHIGPGWSVNAMNQPALTVVDGGPMTSKNHRIAYWVTTAILAFVMLSGGAADVLRQSDATAGMVHLGYPLYFVTILGIWKLLGGMTVLAPGLPRLKEWAYAGAVFDLTGATASHLAVGDDVRHIVTPLVFAAVALASWALRPAGRLLAPAGARA
jgi:DoxX-like family